MAKQSSNHTNKIRRTINGLIHYGVSSTSFEQSLLPAVLNPPQDQSLCQLFSLMDKGLLNIQHIFLILSAKSSFAEIYLFMLCFLEKDHTGFICTFENNNDDRISSVFLLPHHILNYRRFLIAKKYPPRIDEIHIDLECIFTKYFYSYLVRHPQLMIILILLQRIYDFKLHAGYGDKAFYITGIIIWHLRLIFIAYYIEQNPYHDAQKVNTNKIFRLIHQTNTSLNKPSNHHCQCKNQLFPSYKWMMLIIHISLQSIFYYSQNAWSFEANIFISTAHR